jgi:hypothetical protein
VSGVLSLWKERRVTGGREEKLREVRAAFTATVSSALDSNLGLLLCPGLITFTWLQPSTETDKPLASAVVCMCRAIMRPVCCCLLAAHGRLEFTSTSPLCPSHTPPKVQSWKPYDESL